MSKTEIKSENQSGGITAQNVNVSGNIQTRNKTVNSEKEPGSKKIFWWVFGFAGFIAALLTIIQFFE